MRFAFLHARARRLPAAAASVLVVACAAWASGRALGASPLYGGATARLPVVVLAPLLAAVIAAAGLAGDDPSLERSTPKDWVRVRLAHAGAAAAAGATALGAALLHDPYTFGAAAAARNTLGLLGLALAATTAVGAARGWAVPFTYAIVVYLAAPRAPGGAGAVWAWPVQPSARPVPAAIALVLFAAGTSVYGALGAGDSETAYRGRRSGAGTQRQREPATTSARWRSS